MNDVVGRLCAAEDAPKVGDVEGDGVTEKGAVGPTELELRVADSMGNYVAGSTVRLELARAAIRAYEAAPKNTAHAGPYEPMPQEQIDAAVTPDYSVPEGDGVTEDGAVGVMTRTQQLEALWSWLISDGFSDVDGGDMQHKAWELGLVRLVEYDPAIHGEYAAREHDLEPGDEYFEVVKPTSHSQDTPDSTVTTSPPTP